MFKMLPKFIVLAEGALDFVLSIRTVFDVIAPVKHKQVKHLILVNDLFFAKLNELHVELCALYFTYSREQQINNNKII